MSGSGDRDMSASTVPVGEDIGGYIVDGELGSGTMGFVYAATHPVIGKRAAIKVLRPELSRSPAAVERFMMEARAVNQIGHPNIVDIFGFGTLPDGRSYYVMDLLVGESLHQRLRRTGPLHIGEAARIIDEIASALLAAHDKGIIHRDLKPENVFLVDVPDRLPRVSILDWGLLKLSSAHSAIHRGHHPTLAGSLLGTPVYMSPEQARGADKVDFRTDVYSLGVMAYEMLAGTPPFGESTSIGTILAHQDEAVPSLARKRPAVPPELVQLIEAMLAKAPDGRPTLAAVRTVLKRLQASKIPMTTAAGLALPGGGITSRDTPRPEPTPTPQRTKPHTLAGHRPSVGTTTLPQGVSARTSAQPWRVQTPAQAAPTARYLAESEPVEPDEPPDAVTRTWRTPEVGHAALPDANVSVHAPPLGLQPHNSMTAVMPTRARSPIIVILISAIAVVVAVTTIVLLAR